MLSFELSAIDVVLAVVIIIILLLQVKNAQNESATEPKLSKEKSESLGDLSESLTARKTSRKKESATTTEGSADCPYHFGYLKTLPLGSVVPERCYNCSRRRECLFSDE